jgi:DNA-directed RNA polymerase
MYERNDVLEQFRVAVGEARAEVDLPPVPAKGTLDIRGVLKSEFFFA